jgi:hypothetical protein
VVLGSWCLAVSAEPHVQLRQGRAAETPILTAVTAAIGLIRGSRHTERESGTQSSVSALISLTHLLTANNSPAVTKHLTPNTPLTTYGSSHRPDLPAKPTRTTPHSPLTSRRQHPQQSWWVPLVAHARTPPWGTKTSRHLPISSSTY